LRPLDRGRFLNAVGMRIDRGTLATIVITQFIIKILKSGRQVPVEVIMEVLDEQEQEKYARFALRCAATVFSTHCIVVS